MLINKMEIKKIYKFVPKKDITHVSEQIGHYKNIPFKYMLDAQTKHKYIGCSTLSLIFDCPLVKSPTESHNEVFVKMLASLNKNDPKVQQGLAFLKEFLKE